MAYTEWTFFLYFAVVAAIYFFLPGKARRVWLLLCSLGYVFLWQVSAGFFVVGSSLVTYLGARLVAPQPETENREHRRRILAIFLFLIFGLLAVLKYSGMAVDTANSIAGALGSYKRLELPDLVLPVGLSFYTFASAGYLIDSFRGDVKPEKNFGKYLLFLAFFPNFSAGPIERSRNLLRQIQTIDQVNLWDHQRIVSGAFTVLWGYFLKLVIADRAAILVAQVFDRFWAYGSFELLVGAVVFSIQIYGDFAGGSYMALGFARILGFELIDNFNAPYFSLSIKDFWRRWHISLSSWFRDYLYIPLGGNRKGTARKYVNTAVVFLVCGMWHGANWTFLVWGALHALYQVIGGLTKDKREALYQRLHIDTSSGSFHALQRLCVFLLSSFAWILFRAGNLTQAGIYIWRIFARPDYWNVMNGTIYQLGLSNTEMNLLFLGTAALFAVDWLRDRKKKEFSELVAQSQPWVRILIALALLISILFFGCYGSNFGESAFIYAEF